MGKKQRNHSRQERLKKQADKRSVEIAQAKARDAELRRYGALVRPGRYRDPIADHILDIIFGMGK